MPYIHLIALNRTNGCATAYHFSSKDRSAVINMKQKILSVLSTESAKSSVSFQIVPTDDSSYESVVSYNPYFEQFSLIADLQTLQESLDKFHRTELL